MGGAFFAIPIIGVEMIDGYRNVFAKPGSTHPTER
jgi:hypothetical protein